MTTQNDSMTYHYREISTSLSSYGHAGIPYFEETVNINKNKVSKGAKIRNHYNKVPHPTQDTNGKVTNSQ